MLPRPSGIYEVGLTTLGVQISKKITGNGRLKSNNQPALESQEVVFNLYYPTSIRKTNGSVFSGVNGSKVGVRWIQKPLNLAVRGWAKFLKFPSFLLWPIVHFYNAILSIPVYPYTSLLSPISNPSNRSSSSDGPTQVKWPLVIFSHGLGGTRTEYSYYCSQLASDGNVVLAMEHHDGTAPYVTERYNQISNGLPHDVKEILYLSPDDVDFPKKSTESDPGITMPLRLDQLDLRRKEVFNAYNIFRMFIRNPSSEHGLYRIDDNARACKLDVNFCEDWKDAVQVDGDVSFTGHSFGGATLLSILSNPPPCKPCGKPFDPLPIIRAVGLDPWLDPFPSPGPLLRQPGAITASSKPTSLLIINSAGFTSYTDHFGRVQSLIKAWKIESSKDFSGNFENLGTILTLPTSLHINFSDFPLFLPRMVQEQRGDGGELLKLIHQLSTRFLKGDFFEGDSDDSPSYLGELKSEGRLINFEFIPKQVPKRKDGKPVESWKTKRVKGNTGDVVLH